MYLRRWWPVFLIALAVAALLALPYALGYLLTRSGTVYMGLIMNPEDSQSYLAKMLQGYDGEWLYTIPFTPEKHDPAFLGGFYLVLGHLARWVKWPLESVWHGARIVSGLLLFLTTYGFVSVFTKDSWSRWTAYALAILGSGFGWLLFILNQPEWLGAFPVDFKMPEAHLFFTALTFPHVALGITLMMVSFWLLMRAARSDGKVWPYALLAGFTNIILGILYPFIIVLVAVTAGIYWLALCRQARRFLWRTATLFVLPFLLPLPLYIYYAYTYQVNEVFRTWSEQAATLSPPGPHYLIAFGPMLLLALLPYTKWNRRPIRPGSRLLLWSWVLAAALLVYAPFNFQRRFVQGVHVPLAILAAAGLVEVLLPAMENTRIFQRLIARPRYTTTGLWRLILVAIIAFMALSNLYLLADVALTAALRQPYPLFRPREEVDAAAWIRHNTDRSAVVMTAYQTGNYVAAHAGNPVTQGHWAETVQRDLKMSETIQFYDSATGDDWRQRFLARYDVKYIWFGAQERRLGEFSPAEADYLQLVYQSPDIALFAVSE